MDVTPSSCISDPVLESLFRTAWCLQPDVADGQPQVAKSLGGTGLYSWKENKDIHFCCSTWCIKLCVCFNRPMRSPKATLGSCCVLSIGATTAPVTRSQVKGEDGHTVFLKTFGGFCGLGFQLEFLVPDVHCGTPVTMSHGHYSKGRIEKLQCNLQPYGRYRDRSQASSLSGESWKNKPIRPQPFLFPKEMNASW